MNKFPKNERGFYICILIYIASVAVRLLKLTLDPLLLRDGAYYLLLAENWFEQKDWNTIPYADNYPEPPLPLWTIKTMMQTELGSEISGRSVNIIIGSLIPIIVYITTREIIKKKRIVFISTILTIIHPSLISYSIQPIRENLYLFLSGLLILEIINVACSQHEIHWILCGFIISCSVFCRIESLEMLIIIPSIILLFNCKKKKIISINKIALLLLSFIVSIVFLGNITNFDYSFIYKCSYYMRSVYLDE